MERNNLMVLTIDKKISYSTPEFFCRRKLKLFVDFTVKFSYFPNRLISSVFLFFKSADQFCKILKLIAILKGIAD